MAGKLVTWSEQLAGYRLPAYPKHIDTLMAGFVKADGTLGNSFPPVDSWLRPAWRKVKRSGWVRCTNFGLSFMGGKPEYLWTLTPSGEAEALAARARVAAIEAARNQWSRDFGAAYAAQRAA